MPTCVADEGCSKTKLVGRGLCDCHYRMLRMYGRTTRITRPQGTGGLRSDGYIQLFIDGKYKMEHVVMVERLLNKPLPDGAIIHHINEDRADNRYENFVVCPNQAYHMLIHKRMYELGISFRKDGQLTKRLGRPKNKLPAIMLDLFEREEALKRDD